VTIFMQIPCASARDAVIATFTQLQARAAAAGIALRNPPPEPTTCCGRGCNGCVWEGFYDAARFWVEDAQAALALQNL
jgi:Oxidoreductase-like protein, N-terminal